MSEAKDPSTNPRTVKVPTRFDDICIEFWVEASMDRASLACARHFLQDVRNCLARQDYCTIGVSGGSLPNNLGKALKTYFESSPEAKRDVSEIDWSKCSFFLVDERCVPLDHVDSNYRLVIEHIIPNLPGARVEQVYPIDTTLLDNIDLCAHAYEKTLFEYFKSKLSNAADESSFWDAAGLDIALLGMGPDGHICSLFPSKPQSKWTANGIDGCPVSSVGAPYPLVVSIGDSPKPPLSRITMSLPLVCNSHDIIFLCGGAEKQDALDRIVKDPESGETLPAARALPIGYQNAKYTIECVVLNTAASDSNQITLHHSEHSRARNGEVRWFVDAAACKKIAL